MAGQYWGDPDNINQMPHPAQSTAMTQSTGATPWSPGPTASTGLGAQSTNAHGNPFFGFDKEFSPNQMMNDPAWAIRQMMSMPGLGIDTTPGSPFSDFLQKAAAGLPGLFSVAQGGNMDTTGKIAPFFQQFVQDSLQNMGKIGSSRPGDNSVFMNFNELKKAIGGIAGSDHTLGATITQAQTWDAMMQHLLPFLESASLTALDPYSYTAMMTDLQRKAQDYGDASHIGSNAAATIADPWQWLMGTGFLQRWGLG